MGTFSEKKYVKKKLLMKVGLLVQYSSQNFLKDSTNFQHWIKNDFENQNFELFEEVLHNFGMSDGDII